MRKCGERGEEKEEERRGTILTMNKSNECNEAHHSEPLHLLYVCLAWSARQSEEKVGEGGDKEGRAKGKTPPNASYPYRGRSSITTLTLCSLSFAVTYLSKAMNDRYMMYMSVSMYAVFFLLFSR